MIYYANCHFWHDGVYAVPAHETPQHIFYIHPCTHPRMVETVVAHNGGAMHPAPKNYKI